MPPLTAPKPARSSWPERLMVSALAGVLTAAMTYPTVPRLGSAGRLNTGDGRFSIWNVAWVAHALLDDPRHVFDANIFYPHPSTLTYSELNLVAGALGTPAYAATQNPLAAHNSAVVAALFVAFMAMWALVRRLTSSSAAGIVAATGFAFSAYTSSHTAEIQLLMIFGFPLLMLALHRVADRPEPTAGVWLGAALAVTALASGYYGMFAGALLGLAALVWARRTPAYWVAIGLAAVVAAALVAPVLVPYLRDRAAQGVVRTTDLDELRFYSADWRAYLTSSTNLDVKWFPALYGTAGRPREVLFPGIIVTALAVVSLTGLTGLKGMTGRNSTRRIVLGYAAIAVAAAWASLGPDAHLYSVLWRWLPGMSMLRAPARLGIVVIFALAVLAGVGYRQLAIRMATSSGPRANSRAWLLPACLGALVVELWVPWPLEGMPPLPRAYHMLATLPRGGVVEMPFPYISEDFHSHTKAMIRSTANWQPLVNGYSDFIPSDFSDLARPINSFPDAKSFDIMRAHDVRYVVLRVSDYGTTGSFRENLLNRFPPYEKYLRKLTDDQDVWLYEIVSWPEAGRRP